MKESESAITRRVTKPKLFAEAVDFLARAGTKARIDALRGETRQGDFVRELIEDALDRLEQEGAKPDNR